MTAKRRCREAGALLVEMLAALLVMAVAAASLAGMVIQNPTQLGRIERREKANLYGARLLSTLKNYVTADPASVDPCGDAVNLRPCPPGSPTFSGTGATWHLPGDTCAEIPSGREGTCYALAPGRHTADSLLPEDFNFNSGYRVVLGYNVEPSGPGGTAKVEVSIEWREP